MSYLLNIFTPENVVLLLWDEDSNLTWLYSLFTAFSCKICVWMCTPLFLCFGWGRLRPPFASFHPFPPLFPFWQLFCCLDLGCARVCVCVCVCVCVFKVKFRKFSRYFFQWFWTVSFSFIDPSKVETNFVCLLLLILFFSIEQTYWWCWIYILCSSYLSSSLV